jgi:hypothetical protein
MLPRYGGELSEWRRRALDVARCPPSFLTNSTRNFDGAFPLREQHDERPAETGAELG